MIQSPIFVVELNDYILVTVFLIKECIFPIYVFDNKDKTYEDAFKVAEDIALARNKLIANAVDFNLDDPLIYDPKKINDQMENLIKIISAEKEKIKGN